MLLVDLDFVHSNISRQLQNSKMLGRFIRSRDLDLDLARLVSCFYYVYTLCVCYSRSTVDLARDLPVLTSYPVLIISRKSLINVRRTLALPIEVAVPPSCSDDIFKVSTIARGSASMG